LLLIIAVCRVGSLSVIFEDRGCSQSIPGQGTPISQNLFSRLKRRYDIGIGGLSSSREIIRWWKCTRKGDHRMMELYPRPTPRGAKTHLVDQPSSFSSCPSCLGTSFQLRSTIIGSSVRLAVSRAWELASLHIQTITMHKLPMDDAQSCGSKDSHISASAGTHFPILRLSRA
jgi:hypothetical protein